MFPRRLLCGIFFAIAVSTVSVSLADPQRAALQPITIVVPFPPGGSTDIVARVVAEHMSSSLGTSVIVENVSGAGGSVGLSRVARAAPDDRRTWLVVSNWTSHIGSPVLYPVQFDIEKDFQPVARLTSVPLMMIGSPKMPAQDLKAAISWLKGHADSATAATVGVGSASQLCTIDFQNKTQTSFKLVPYRGNAPAVQDVLGSQVDIMCGEASGMLPHVRAGTVKAYAVMAEKRWFAAPDIPTSEEAGAPGAGITFWHGLWAAKVTSRETVLRLSQAVTEALADPVVTRRLTDAGHEIPASDQQSAAALDTLFHREAAKWWPIIKAANIKAQ
ncbi:tripartite tricarboxylate transporter substrate binding protein BugD [Bradyrhizobium sediminis]|uniref:Tripartite tricarboxylate transporter substrate binding protein BugD n=1 Tax=Bradyrhizobium sediminis TaxID=2840469 RepID=A0A975RRK6_9BRAD|nr:tripartite tricarboxylate transporter substrate-binding protein [Bradyrhizobium sediminis]QWG17099.1 tripartite tricarboxylate transporter substrate binding protein BugD [Bradyrhizobium sediminis]